jgi:hypothetical protein
VYSLTRTGDAELRAETDAWTQFVKAMSKVLRATTQPA